MNKYNNNIGKLLTIFGVLFVLLATVIAGSTIYKDIRGKNLSQSTLVELNNNINYETLGKDIDYMQRNEGRMSNIEIDSVNYVGIIEIPKLSLKLPLQDDWSDEALNSSPCRYTGSLYENNMVIMGHNFKSHLGKIKNLISGDKIDVVDVYGVKHSYTVTHKEILSSKDVSKMIESDSDLTLFTCDLDRSKRITIRCNKDI